ncbi:MAG TPA: Rieske 2Fe-2S domain-containing protein [Gammaproteobacteria bacterium]|jgi:nitrite reductase/ring-hydroxylating ferredoxin subunit|nr:Rieske 2Fe-2S domain-containing protein [Gammaproteobacteria bacterium]HJP38083.1 Rieske 2Fe-2S domain-containing protein [Gammaproteobacteria bacterium]
MTLVSDDNANNWPEWLVMNADELGDPDARSFLVGDGDWPFDGFIVRRQGKIFAYANNCPHRHHPLNLEPHAFLIDNGNLIRCTSHGALFCPETGVCLSGPCAGHRLIALACRTDPDGAIRVCAPDTLLDQNLAK